MLCHRNFSIGEKVSKVDKEFQKCFRYFLVGKLSENILELQRGIIKIVLQQKSPMEEGLVNLWQTGVFWGDGFWWAVFLFCGPYTGL